MRADHDQRYRQGREVSAGLQGWVWEIENWRSD